MATKKQEHPASVYLKHSLMHPWHVVILATATVFGVANWSLLVMLLVFLGAEIALHTFLFRMQTFRDYVDDKLHQLEKAAAQEKRSHLMERMTGAHRNEYLSLDRYIANQVAKLSDYPGHSHLLAEECFALLSSYVRLALMFSLMGGETPFTDLLDAEIKLTEALRLQLRQPTSSAARQRIEILQKRVELRNSHISIHTELSLEMELIKDKIKYACERACSPCMSGVRVEVDTPTGLTLFDELGGFSQVEEFSAEEMQAMSVMKIHGSNV